MNMLRVVNFNDGMLFLYLGDKPLEVIVCSDLPSPDIQDVLAGAEAVLRSQGDFETHFYDYDGEEFDAALETASGAIDFNLFPEFWQLEEIGGISEVDCWF
jgi:hypothetical protein